MINIILFVIILVNIFIFYYFNKISEIVNLYDFPNKKLKIHKTKTSLIGGSIIIINIFLVFFLNLLFKSEFLSFFPSFKNELIFLAMLSIFFMLGFLDDKFNINPNKKFFFLIIISVLFIVLDQNLLIQKFSLSFYKSKIFLDNYSFIFSVFCILILINAMNFYDGINGQSLIFFLITFSYLLIVSEKIEFYLFIISILFFLLFLNLRNRLFLGDNGIYTLTIILSTSLIYEHNFYGSITFADEIFLLLFLPGLDLLRLTILRLMKKNNPFYGDRNHIHHLLIKKYSLIKTNIILFILAIVPILFFNILKLNFFLVIFIFLIFYSVIILKLNKYGS
ncbi:hypothetical protein IDH17_01055 [Pelagibacterales bacterium SAG-MED37]|nr:hypothetical protein [Pelagibacterales bacterium SAG-MED37]